MKNKIQKYKPYLPAKPRANKQLYKCPNCETYHKGNFCHNCGQSVHEIQKPLKEFILDILGSLYAFDLKFWQSIKVMFTKPEMLSRNFLNGKRAGYTPPFKLYFFVSFIFFFMVNWKAESVMKADDSFKIDETRHLMDSVFSEIDEENKITVNLLSDSLSDISATDAVYSKKTFKLYNLSNNRVGELIKDKDTRILFLNKALKYSSWMLFLLMPIYALFLMMLHYRREKFYVSHLVFAVNTHTQLFMILILVLLLEFSAKGLLLLTIPVYTVWAMKKFYNQSWRKTILKFFILTSLYNFVLLAAFIVVFLITIGTF